MSSRICIACLLLISCICFAQPSQPLPQGPGLAAKYPADAGIDKDPAVLLTEQFDSGNIQDLRKRWQSIKNPDGEVLSFSDDVPSPAAGNRSMLMTATLGRNDGGDLYTTFPGVDKAFLRFYVKFAPDHAYEHHFVELGGYEPSLPYPYPHAGAKPTGDERMLVLIDPVGEYGKYPPPGIWSLYTYWADMKISADNYYWGNCINPSEPQRVITDRWQCVELMIKMNSAPDKYDGELALWLDGRLVMHVKKGTPRGLWSGMGFDVLKEGGTPFEGLRLRTSEKLKINHVWLEHYIDYGAQRFNRLADPNKVNRVWFDNVVVSTEYIGPIQPAAKAEGQAKEKK